MAESIKQISQEPWYTQGTNAVPLFIVTSAQSAFKMKRVLGFGYTKFLFHFKKEYGEMKYVETDFDRVWKEFEKRLKRDGHYLQKVKKQYQIIFKKHQKVFKEIQHTDLTQLSDTKLLKLLRSCMTAQTDSVGIAHIIESVGQILERHFRVALHNEIPDKRAYTDTFSYLTTPAELSFVAREERELLAIAKMPQKKQAQALKRHAKNYSWIQNTYAGSVKIDEGFLKKKMSELLDESKKNKSVRREKKDVRSVSKEIQHMASIIRFMTTWQDERKEKILLAIEYLDKIAEEIARRIHISKRLLFYVVREPYTIKKIQELAGMRDKFEARRRGCYVLMRATNAVVFTGKQYAYLARAMKAQEQKKEAERLQVNGMIANGGAAIGRVVICKDVSQMHKVEAGDILVTSMTRPEFMPALKKAAAIVTDEGGITSHAAIVARELNIPAVIGTKVATKILRTGMQVEVRANHGMVKILS